MFLEALLSRARIFSPWTRVILGAVIAALLACGATAGVLWLVGMPLAPRHPCPRRETTNRCRGLGVRLSSSLHSRAPLPQTRTRNVGQGDWRTLKAAGDARTPPGGGKSL